MQPSSRTVLASLILAAAAAAPAGALQQRTCASTTGWTFPKATVTPSTGNLCAWEWYLKMNPLALDLCGPASDFLGLSGSNASASAWGMQIGGFAHAWDLSGSTWISCSAARTGAGALTLVFLGPADPPCAPRVQVDWRPLWRWYLYLNPPGQVVLGGQMKGKSQSPPVTVDAHEAPAFATASTTPAQVCFGPVCVPVTLLGGGGRRVGEVADHDGGIAMTELTHLTWSGGTSVYARAEFSLTNWISDAEGGLCDSDPGLFLRADCAAPYCPGVTQIAYHK